MLRVYYKFANYVIFMYNISNRESYKSITEEIQICKNINPKNKIVLVGNKKEINGKRLIPYEEGNSFAVKYGIKFYEISSVTGENFDELLFDSFNDLIKGVEEGYYNIKEKNEENK